MNDQNKEYVFILGALTEATVNIYQSGNPTPVWSGITDSAGKVIKSTTDTSPPLLTYGTYNLLVDKCDYDPISKLFNVPDETIMYLTVGCSSAISTHETTYNHSLISSTNTQLNTHLNATAPHTGLGNGVFMSLKWRDMVVVQGIWIQQVNYHQKDIDIDFYPNTAGGGMQNRGSRANLDEFKLPSLTLNAGKYEIKVVTKKDAQTAILEVLHGNTSIGTEDLYYLSYDFPYDIDNYISTFIYSPIIRTVGDLRFRINGKNPLSFNYDIHISRIQIRKIE